MSLFNRLESEFLNKKKKPSTRTGRYYVSIDRNTNAEPVYSDNRIEKFEVYFHNNLILESYEDGRIYLYAYSYLDPRTGVPSVTTRQRINSLLTGNLLYVYKNVLRIGISSQVSYASSTFHTGTYTFSTFHDGMGLLSEVPITCPLFTTKNGTPSEFLELLEVVACLSCTDKLSEGFDVLIHAHKTEVCSLPSHIKGQNRKIIQYLHEKYSPRSQDPKDLSIEINIKGKEITPFERVYHMEKLSPILEELQKAG